MTNKIKNIARKGISLVLALTMMMPTGAFAITETESKWGDYKYELKKAIMMQDDITIELGDGIRFTSEGIAIQAITEAYNGAIKEIPNYFEINIADTKRSPIIEKNASDSYLLKQVNHDITYYNDFASINNVLSVLYAEINTKQTYYDKIRTAYDYIIEQLEYETNSENHNIESSINKVGGVSAKAYAMLFSIIMDRLGYENIIVEGTIQENKYHAWNLVKVQGNWYHVDSKLGDVNYFSGDRDKFFLTSNETMENSEYKHVWDRFVYPTAGGNYDSGNSLQYEIDSIVKGIDDSRIELIGDLGNGGIKAEIEGIQTHEGTVLTKGNIDIIKEEVKVNLNTIDNIKEKIDNIKEKIKGYRNSIDVLSKISGVTEGTLWELSAKLEQVEVLLGEVVIDAELVLSKLINKEQAIFIKEKEILTEAENEKAIEAVDTAEINMKKILEDGVDTTQEIIIAEASIKIAVAEINKIKDIVVKANQQNRINQIKLVIAAIKAVDKAETVTPLRMTYVISARTAIGKVMGYELEKGDLNTRLDEIEATIIAADAITKAVIAVEKVEKYMKVTDIVLAREAVESLKLLTTNDELEAKIKELNRRIFASEKVIEVESSFTKYLYESSVETGVYLQTAIDIANDAITKLAAGDVKTQRKNRMIVIVNAKVAIEKIEEAKDDVTIEAAKEAISKVTDIKIQNELANKLEDIISQKETSENKENAVKAVNAAKSSLGDEKTKSIDNLEVVAKAVVEVNKLPTGIEKTSLQTTIKELNNAIKAKQIVENAEAKEAATLTEKDVIAAEKAILTVKLIYKPGLDLRVDILRDNFETNKAIEILQKAKDAVGKAEATKITTDITTAKKAVELVNNVYEKANLKARIKAMESYVATIKVLVNAEKYRNLENKIAAEYAFAKLDEVIENVKAIDPTVYKNVYEGMKNDINKRIIAIGTYLTEEAGKVTSAEAKVKAAEAAMTVDTDPTDELIQPAQDAVNMVTDKTLRAGLQKRIDAIQIAKYAKLAVAKAVAYPNENSVKDAETALDKVDGRYSDIIENLSKKIAELRNKLDITKKVTEATSLVQKAVDSRKKSDSINARFAVDNLKVIALDSHTRLTKILDELDTSIDNATGIETDALAAAKIAINGAIVIIGDTNTYIAQIIEGEYGEIGKIKTAYEKIESAKIEVIKANAAVRKLTDQKALLAEIDYANKEIELAEDNIDVKEAVRLVTIASSSVNDAKTEATKSMAKLDIAAARRAIDKIGHSNNKAIKTTILNTINSIEKKLTTDNDQELIDAAVVKVNEAADMVTNAVRENTVIADQEIIDKTIFAAKMAIGWISDNNKAAKATLTGFINDIEAMFIAEKDGIQNEERIKNAENAVKEAESKKGSDELESYIRSARLRINIIKNDGPETGAKIDDLNTRLDILEGKSDGSSGNSGSDGNNNTGGSSSGNKPGNSSIGNIIPTTPLPESKRVIGTTEPIWGKTKELKKANPTTGLSIQDMTAFKVSESKSKTIELSNVLNTTSSTNATLVVRGKTIKLDSKPYINDKVNNSILLPIKFLGDELGFTVSLIDNPIANGAKRLLINGFVNGASKSIIMDIGSEYGYENGSLVKISSKPVIQEGRIYIPVDFMVEHLGLNFSYYNESGNIQLIIN